MPGEESCMNVRLDKTFLQTHEQASGTAFSNIIGYTVTGPKLHLFLKECAIGRPNNVTLRGMVPKAQVLQQKHVNANSNVSRRDVIVRTLIKMIEFTEEDRTRKNDTGRGSDTLFDDYATNHQIQCT
ncbi:Hypothetical protein PHPALM_36641 [Phytophthora palmivora]|uniref:Uncharacterized protein n=1 Tax=Phytophthora palmivora TaxID=4796 RepID=A0A2P4WZF0_9STRA|nr:Hypothetical protein PHPALM_36641 [Phytophthora palmivora]